MKNANFPLLTSPFKIGPVNLRNRAVIPGHSMVHGDSSGLVTGRYQAYLARRAMGGAALVGIESAPVHPHSRTWLGQLELWRDDIIDSLSETSDQVHAAGSKLSIILWHGGHNVGFRRNVAAVAPSVIPSVQVGEIPRAMSEEDIKDLVSYYHSAALRCTRGGLDVLEIQTSSDYLLGSFLSPQLNHRTDKYGGSVKNRCRFVLEILEKIRSDIPSNVALGIRTSIYHAIPGEPEGYTIDHSLPAMQEIAGSGLIDYLSVMSGSNANFAETIAPMTYPRPQIADLSARIKDELNVPITVSGRIVTPEEAEGILEKGQADLVGVARAVISDPDWMKKTEQGQAHRIRLCTGCNQVCLGFAARGLPAGCNINSEAGYEDELTDIIVAKNRKRIAIVGGGPAGLECARVAAERGHEVVLYEALPELGGALRLSANAPYREELSLPLDWWESELKHLNVEVKLDTFIRGAEDIDADEIVWATGAEPESIWQMRFRPSLVDGIPGTGNLPHGRDVLAGKETVSGRVAVVDEEGGWPALNLIEALVAQEDITEIDVITSSPLLGMPDLFMTGEFPLFSDRLKKAGVNLYTGQFVLKVEDKKIYTSDDTTTGPYDSIVLSLGSRSRTIPKGVHAVGDCIAPRDLWAAVKEGNRLGRSL